MPRSQTSGAVCSEGLGRCPNKQKQRFPAAPGIAVSGLCGNKDTACKVANYRQRFILNSDFNRIVIRRCATGQAGRLYIQTLKTDFQRYRRKPVFACWDSVPNPLNNPLPGLAARSETERWYGGCFQKRIATNGD